MDESSVVEYSSAKTQRSPVQLYVLSQAGVNMILDYYFMLRVGGNKESFTISRGY